MRIVFIFLLITSVVFGQKATKREWTIFQKGVQEYKTGHYELALKDFKLVLSKIKDNHLLTAHRLMLAKSLYKTGKYKASLQECRDFIKKFPNSRYKPYIRFLEAENYYRLERLQSAVETWLLAAEESTEKILSGNALRLADETVRFRLDNQGLAYLKTELKSDFALQFVLYHMAERDYEKGNFPPAQASLRRALALKGNNTAYEKKAQRLLEYLNDKKSNAIRIAALLPFSGANAEIGQALYDGAQMAVDKFNRENGPTLELIPFDYETRLPTALLKFKEIARDFSISAVYGPVENDIAAACAVMAEYEHIPLITPTATESDLRTLSSSVVQLSVPMDISVQKLVRYAQDSLALKRFATVAPIDDYFVRMVKIFAQKQEQLGNSIVSQQWYYPGVQDITPKFKALKRVGIKLAFQDSVLNDNPDLTQRMIDSLYVLYHEEQVKYNEETNTKIDSADIPVKTIDGLFMPLFPDEISPIASQYAYWNIQGQILGNSDWYDPEILKKNKNYVNGLIFVTNGYFNKESWDYRKFRNSFRDTYKRTPEKYEMVGFDSFNFILSALDGAPKSISREVFSRRIKEAPVFNGVYRSFEVGKKRFNDAARILKYTYGQILPLN